MTERRQVATPLTRCEWLSEGCGAWVRLWHFSEMVECPARVRYAHQSGRPPTTPIHRVTI
jgi:hypothetical protein